MTEPTNHELIGRLYEQVVERGDIAFITSTPAETSISVHGLDAKVYPLHNADDSTADTAIRARAGDGPDAGTHWLYVARPTALDALQAAASFLAFPPDAAPEDLLASLRRSLS
ncbi:hypothetical protein [Gordonia terrae]|uniref:hypothetical protein n=1 Tax=Gordonia terrae TaxID=2055 RepID=UPI003F6C203A